MERGKKEEESGLFWGIRCGTKDLCRSKKAYLLAIALFPYLKNNFLLVNVGNEMGIR